MSAKISKSMKVELITQFFRNNGQHMTNLGKADITKLDGIITKYNINIEYELQKLQQLKEQQKIEKEARDKKYEEERENLRLEREAEQAEMNKLWSSISNLQQRWVCDRLKNTINEKRQKNNEFAIRTTDVMEADFKKNGARIVRESPTELRVNGILVCNNYIEKMMTTDEVFELMPTHLKFYKNSIKDIKILLERKELKGKNIEFDIQLPS